MEQRERMRSGGKWWLAAFAVVFVGCALWIFWPVLPLHLVTVSPDAPHVYSASYASEMWQQMLCAKNASIYPDRLHQLFVNPYAWQEIEYALPCLMAALALAWYLRVRRLPWLAAFASGLFFAFCGYSFTLLNAGHRGWFTLIAYTLFSFGLLARCFSEERRWIHFALLGAVLAWGEMEQPDIWLIFAALVGCYAIWRFVCRRREKGSWREALALAPRFLVSLAFMVAIGAGAFKFALVDTVAGRQEQLSGAQPKSAEATTPSPEEAKRAAEEKWIFATNWSLPPEDWLEAIVPGVYGDDSLRSFNPLAPAHPYWGRLGRPHESVFQAGRMLPNYRQHTLYLGLIPVVFALVGVIFWKGRRRDQDELAYDASDVPFWTGALVVAGILALGRYTPIYRAVFAIPGMGLVRAPVKFYHVAELATAVLAGYGIAAMLARRCACKIFLWVAGGVFAFLLIAFIVCEGDSVTRIANIAALGFGKKLAVELQANMRLSFVRSLCLSVALIAAAWWILWRGRKSGRAVLVTLSALTLMGTIDLASVDGRYIVPLDVTADIRRMEAGVSHEIPGRDPIRALNVLSMLSGAAVLGWAALSALRGRRCEKGEAS